MYKGTRLFKINLNIIFNSIVIDELQTTNSNNII